MKNEKHGIAFRISYEDLIEKLGISILPTTLVSVSIDDLRDTLVIRLTDYTGPSMVGINEEFIKSYLLQEGQEYPYYRI